MPLLNMMAILAMISLMLFGCSSKEDPCNETSITEEEYILRIRRNEGRFTAQLMDAEMYQKERDYFFEPKESDIIP